LRRRGGVAWVRPSERKCAAISVCYAKLGLARVVLHERSVPAESSALDSEIASPAVSPLDLRAQAASEARLLVQVEPGLSRDRAVELRPTDDSAVEQDLAELFPALGLVEQRFVELAALDNAVYHEYRPQQGPVAAVLVHVLPPIVVPRAVLARDPTMPAAIGKRNPPF